MENKKDCLVATGSGRPAAIWAGGEDPELAEREFTLADSWFTVWKRRRVMALFTLATLLLVSLFTFLKKPVYESVAQIQYDSTKSGSLGLEEMISQTFSSGDADQHLQTQAKILESDTVAMAVIKRLDLAHKEEFTGKLDGAEKIDTKDPMEMTPKQRDHLLLIFHGSAKVAILPKTQIIEIRVRSTDRALATDMVNTIVDAYLEWNFQSHYQGTIQVSNWLSKQMEELKSVALGAQRKLADFQQQHDIIGTDENDNIVLDKLKQLNEQLTNADADRMLKEARYRLAQTENPELIAAVIPGTTLQVLRSQEADLKAQLAQVDSKYGSGYPKVRELKSQVARMDASIQEEISNVGQRLREEYRAADKTEQLVRGQFEAQKQEAFKLNRNAAEFAILKHQVESSQGLSDSLELKLKEAMVSAGLASANINIVDRGKVPDEAVFPKKKIFLSCGLLLGLFGGLMLAFALESLDDTITTSDQIESWAGLPALASIPCVLGEGRHSRALADKVSTNGFDLVTLKRPQSNVAEAYRSLRSSLLLSNVDQTPKVIVISSGFPSEGKTMTSSNCAITLAQRGVRVLLVDGDLRRSSIHKRFGLGQETGLTTLLAGTSGDECIKTPIAELPTLSVLVAGPRPPAPSEMLSSLRMQEVLKKWSVEYDHIVFDTSPIFPVADALVLAAQADAVLLVVRAGVTRKKALQRMKEVLSRVNARITGVVLNASDLKLEHYYSGPYHYGFKTGYYKNSYEGYYSDSEKD